jgi:hypothetical protein
MADDVRAIAHYTLDIENKVGAGAKILGSLRGSVNFIAIWGYATGSGRAKLELIPDDADAFAAAAKAAGLDAGTPVTAFYVKGDDRRGAIADTLGKLADANVGIEAAQAVSDGEGRFGGVIYVAAADVQKAAVALDAR